MNRPITAKQLEAYARILRHLKDTRVGAPGAVDALHARFQAKDASDTVWTVGIRSNVWHLMVNGDWVAAQPPARELFIDEDLASLLDQRNPDRPDAPTPTAQPSLSAAPHARTVKCSNCGTQLLPGQKFCPACGTPRPVEPPRCPNPVCGAVLPPGARFCISCGQRVDGVKTVIDRTVLGTGPTSPLPAVFPVIESLQPAQCIDASPLPPSPISPPPPPPPPPLPTPPVARVCLNPACRKVVPEGKKYCTACGTRVV